MNEKTCATTFFDLCLAKNSEGEFSFVICKGYTAKAGGVALCGKEYFEIEAVAPGSIDSASRALLMDDYAPCLINTADKVYSLEE